MTYEPTPAMRARLRDERDDERGFDGDTATTDLVHLQQVRAMFEALQHACRKECDTDHARHALEEVRGCLAEIEDGVLHDALDPGIALLEEELT